MRALLIGREPAAALGWSYVTEPPYDAVVIGSLSLGSLLRFREEPVLEALAQGKSVYLYTPGLPESPKNRALAASLTAAQREEKVRQALLDVGLLPEFASRFPHEFSGGQRQRIGIARALIVEPEFIIADEPISALDMSIRAQVLNLLRHLQKERGITYLFIAHDLSVMRYISDRIAVIHKGDIVELADAEELVTHAIHPYTRSLLSAIPMPNPRLERKKKLLVYDPAMHDYTQEAPQWRELRPSHWVLCSEQEAKDWLAEM